MENVDAGLGGGGRLVAGEQADRVKEKQRHDIMPHRKTTFSRVTSAKHL